MYSARSTSPRAFFGIWRMKGSEARYNLTASVWLKNANSLALVGHVGHQSRLMGEPSTLKVLATFATDWSGLAAGETLGEFCDVLVGEFRCPQAFRRPLEQLHQQANQRYGVGALAICCSKNSRTNRWLSGAESLSIADNAGADDPSLGRALK